MSRIPQLDRFLIPLEDIKLATNNFSYSNIIARGGFGNVYKGQLPISASATATRTSTTVAVKRLDVKKGQGDREFMTELSMLARNKHDNLSSLVGFCDEGDEKIIIYKYEARGSLDKYLATDLTWVQRLQICLGAARGVNYLHAGVGKTHRVLHRDIKSSNVLLDENWDAKISDFGLSKIGLRNHDMSFVVTHAAGTYGYIDPVYKKTGVLTKESDVYSFGVVLFEVLCGRLTSIYKYKDDLSRLATVRYEEGKLDEIILPAIRGQMKPDSLEIFATIAYQCLKEARQDRPTMALVVEQLQKSLGYQTGRLRLTQLCGSDKGGGAWSLLLDKDEKIRKITIDHDNCIWCITFTTEDLCHSLRSPRQYGGGKGSSPGSITEVHFDIDEEMTGIRIGATTFGIFSSSNLRGLTLISSISIITNKKMYGPFGKEPDHVFSEFWDAGSFGGFYGRSGYYLDGLGCYIN